MAVLDSSIGRIAARAIRRARSPISSHTLIRRTCSIGTRGSHFCPSTVESRRDDPDFERRLQGCLSVFPVFWLGLLLSDGMRRIADDNFDGWLINEMEPNARLRRYLARALAWPGPDPTAALLRLGDMRFF